MSQERLYEILLTSATSSLERFTLAPSYLYTFLIRERLSSRFYLYFQQRVTLLISLSGASLTPFIHLSSRALIYTQRLLHMLSSFHHFILVFVCFFPFNRLHIGPSLLFHPPSLSLALVLLSRSSLSPQGGD